MSTRQVLFYWLFFVPLAFPGLWLLTQMTLSAWLLLLLTILNAVLAGGVAYPLAMRAGKVRSA